MNPNTLYLNLNPEICPTLDQDQDTSLFTQESDQFWEEKVRKIHKDNSTRRKLWIMIASNFSRVDPDPNSENGSTKLLNKYGSNFYIRFHKNCFCVIWNRIHNTQFWILEFWVIKDNTTVYKFLCNLLFSQLTCIFPQWLALCWGICTCSRRKIFHASAKLRRSRYDTGIYTVYGYLLGKMHYILYVNKICMTINPWKLNIRQLTQE